MVILRVVLAGNGDLRVVGFDLRVGLRVGLAVVTVPTALGGVSARMAGQGESGILPSTPELCELI